MIKIVTDSTCDLPADGIARYDIRVVPLYINIAGKGYRDGIEITREEFYTRLPESNPPATTAVPSPEMFRQVYTELANQGATEILSLHISTALSAVVNSAQVAAHDMQRARVTVMDARQLSMGLGFIVETAARAVAAGQSLDAVVQCVNDTIKRTRVFTALDTLEFLKRSGRMNGAIAAMGTLLQVKPLLKMYDGKPVAERVRTREGATRRLLELLESVGALERVAIIHTHAAARAAELRERAKHLLPPGEIADAEITPVIGAHIGPNAVGFACVAKT
jgi:DegV family protein with EDD domain